VYRVEWVESAVSRLAEAWADADAARRAAITGAANHIDEVLSAMPNEVGESRQANRRIIIDDPLAAIYEVDEARGTVTVLDVLVRSQRSS
jgi:hypothetical protein